MILLSEKKETKLTPFEKNCYGMSEADIREEYMNGLTARLSGLDMVVGGILSDCQEMLEMGYDKDAIRKQLNIAKFIVFSQARDARAAA